MDVAVEADVLALLHPELEWVVSALAALGIAAPTPAPAPAPVPVPVPVPVPEASSWLGRLANTLPWQTALHLHPLMMAAAATRAGDGLACYVPQELARLCNLDATPHVRESDSGERSPGGARALALSPACRGGAGGAAAASTTVAEGPSFRRRQYVAFFNAASISDALAVELTARLVGASALAAGGGSGGRAAASVGFGFGGGGGGADSGGDGDGGSGASINMPALSADSVHTSLDATSFIGCLTVTLATCTAEQVERILQHVVSPCIDGMIIEAAPCFTFPDKRMAIHRHPGGGGERGAGAGGGGGDNDAGAGAGAAASLEAQQQQPQLWDTRQLPHSVGITLRVWTRITLSLNAAAARSSSSSSSSSSSNGNGGGGGECRALGRMVRAYSQAMTSLFDRVASKESWGISQLAALVQIMYYVTATAQLVSAPPASGDSTLQAPRQLVILAISLLDKCLVKKSLACGAGGTVHAEFLSAVLQAVEVRPYPKLLRCTHKYYIYIYPCMWNLLMPRPQPARVGPALPAMLALNTRPLLMHPVPAVRYVDDVTRHSCFQLETNVELRVRA